MVEEDSSSIYMYSLPYSNLALLAVLSYSWDKDQGMEHTVLPTMYTV
jgi:hypothetical protein